MDTNFSEKINELLNKWQKLSGELEALKAEIDSLKALERAAEPVSESAPADADEVIDIEDINVEPEAVAEPEPVVEPEVAAEPVVEPEVVSEPVTEPAPEPEAVPEDMPENLFGVEISEKDGSPVRRRRPSKAIYQTTVGSKAVVDVMASKAAWRTDMPGPEVRSLRSAIALGDQVVFINRLFRKDSALYQTTIDTLNNTGSLSDAIDFLSETFPDWDLESEDVYRFMMAVRRKIRK